MTNSDDMINIAQRELQKLIGQDTSSICKSKERMIGKDRPQTHRPRMKNRLMTHTAKTSMAMYNLNLFSDDDITEDRKKGEDRGESRFSVNDEKWYMIHL